MLSDSKVIEIFYMADDFCKFFNETVKKNIQSKMAKNIGVSQVVSPMPK